jgi:hypothetical protein
VALGAALLRETTTERRRMILLIAAVVLVSVGTWCTWWCVPPELRPEGLSIVATGHLPMRTSENPLQAKFTVGRSAPV